MIPQQQAILDRGRRLIDLRGCTGYTDLVTISQKLAEESEDALKRFDGWDKDQLFGLQQRAKGAMEHHERLLGVIEETIGIATSYAATGEVEKPEELTDEDREQLQSFLVGQ